MESVYLVCYDIADPKRLRKVHKATEDHGERVQFSVYQCSLTNMQVAEFKADLRDIIELSEDQVLFIRLGPEKASTYEKIESLGVAYQAPGRQAYVV